MTNDQYIEKFDEARERAEIFYKALEKVRCPYLQSDVYFNASGLEHLKFKAHARARNRHDQYMRFKLLHLAPEVLKLSRTVQGISHTKHFERARVHSRTDTILKPVSYYEFIAVIGSARVKVVIKQIEDGQSFFWSLIPFWGIDTATKRRRLFAGDPEHD